MWRTTSTPTVHVSRDCALLDQRFPSQRQQTLCLLGCDMCIADVQGLPELVGGGRHAACQAGQPRRLTRQLADNPRSGNTSREGSCAQLAAALASRSLPGGLQRSRGPPPPPFGGSCAARLQPKSRLGLHTGTAACRGGRRPLGCMLKWCKIPSSP